MASKGDTSNRKRSGSRSSGGSRSSSGRSSGSRSSGSRSSGSRSSSSRSGSSGSRSSGSRSSSSRSGSSGSRSSNGNGRLSSAKLIRLAREQAHELTGRPVEGVLGMRRDEDGGFEVLVEIVELRRVPATTDVLGSYLLTLDDSGELVEYRRTRRYHRNQVEEE